jgi:hypothetical protein
MPDFKYSDVLRTLFPKGPIWAFKAFGHADKLVETIGDAKEIIRDYLKSLTHIRTPDATPILADLEREYGITPASSLTEADRRSILAGYVYAKAGSGKDDLQARLHAAGFTDLYVHHNDPLVNPSYYAGGLWSAVCAHEDTVCGNQECYCGQLGVGGYVLANGPVYDDNGNLHEYVIPAGSSTWPMVFFIGSAKGATVVGFVVFQDGDMEYGTDPDSILEDGDAELSTTSLWTAGEGIPS